MKFKLISIYFGFWILSIIPNFVYPFGDTGIFFYSVFITFHPIVILCISYLAFKLGVQSFERINEKKRDDKLRDKENFKTDMSEYSD